MSKKSAPFHLPTYQDFNEAILPLALPLSAAFIHGILCGYLCANHASQGEAYIQALGQNKQDFHCREAILYIFRVYSISQTQLSNFDFEFEMLLPDDDTSLALRAKSFSDWCDGFSQGMAISGVTPESLEEEETQDAFMHIVDFADIDLESLTMDEEDEQALFEVEEYARMAVLRLHQEIKQKNTKKPREKDKTKH